MSAQQSMYEDSCSILATGSWSGDSGGTGTYAVIKRHIPIQSHLIPTGRIAADELHRLHLIAKKGWREVKVEAETYQPKLG
jgi:hypothetical protein